MQSIVCDTPSCFAEVYPRSQIKTQEGHMTLIGSEALNRAPVSESIWNTVSESSALFAQIMKFPQEVMARLIGDFPRLGVIFSDVSKPSVPMR